MSLLALASRLGAWVTHAYAESVPAGDLWGHSLQSEGSPLSVRGPTWSDRSPTRSVGAPPGASGAPPGMRGPYLV